MEKPGNSLGKSIRPVDNERPAFNKITKKKKLSGRYV